jgi:hypothetical protein
MHPLAVAFRASLAATCPQVQLTVQALGFDGFGLVVRVSRLEATRYNPDFVSDGPAARRPLFSPEGQRLWEWLWALGSRAVAAHGQPGDLFGLIHDPDTLFEEALASEALAKEAA